MGEEKYYRIITELNSSKPEVRAKALDELATLERSEIPAQILINDPNGSVNLHMHSIFSYNPYGWSPARCVWEALLAGAEYVGGVEFDVLDHLEELFEAGDRFNIKVVGGVETRVFAPEFGGRVINSPGEENITYAMGHAIPIIPNADSDAGQFLADMKAMARERNLEILTKVNAHLGDIGAIDYENEVITLTPKGNATERHMVQAYEKKVRDHFGANVNGLCDYWADKLSNEKKKVTPDDIRQVLAEDKKPKLYKLIRGQLMKQGGVGYITPDPNSFPLMTKFFEWIKECKGIPVATWLNGNSDGEKDPTELLGIYKEAGAAALNIIPDRNFNHDFPGGWPANDQDYQNLVAVIEAAKELNWPISFGTELNTAGHRVMDIWDSPALKPYKKFAYESAQFFYEHSQKQRALLLQ